MEWVADPSGMKPFLSDPRSIDPGFRWQQPARYGHTKVAGSMSLLLSCGRPVPLRMISIGPMILKQTVEWILEALDTGGRIAMLNPRKLTSRRHSLSQLLVLSVNCDNTDTNRMVISK